MQELPFMATENIIVAMVKSGANRQECHEEIRRLSQEAGNAVKLQGAENDFVLRLRSNHYFAPIHRQLDNLLNPLAYIGRAPQQVKIFIITFIKNSVFYINV